MDISNRYVRLAKEMLSFQLNRERNLQQIVADSCEECDVEAEVCGFEYEDVMRLLDAAISNNPKNAEAAYLLGRVYWLKSYVGYGEYSQEYLLESRKFLERATQLGVSEKVRPKLNYYLDDIRSALSGKYQSRKCE